MCAPTFLFNMTMVMYVCVCVREREREVFLITPQAAERAAMAVKNRTLFNLMLSASPTRCQICHLIIK